MSAAVGGRWLYHVRLRGEGGDLPRYAPSSFAREGFVHASYAPSVLESARLYFPAGAALELVQIDPRRLDVPVVEADTPRGPMPHVHGTIPRDAIASVVPIVDVNGSAPTDLVDP